MFLLALVLYVAPVVGLFWLVFKRCQLTLAQFMVGVFSYAVALAAINERFPNEPDRLIPLAICAALMLGLGLFLGGRICRPYAGWGKWHVYLCGLSAPYAAIFWPASVMMIAVQGEIHTRPPGPYFWIGTVSGAVFGAIILGTVLYTSWNKKLQPPD